MVLSLKDSNYRFSSLPTTTIPLDPPHRRRLSFRGSSYFFFRIFALIAAIACLVFLIFTSTPTPSTLLPEPEPIDDIAPVDVPELPPDNVDQSCGLHQAPPTPDPVWSSPSFPLPLTAALSDRIAAWRAAPLAPRPVWTEFGKSVCGTPRVLDTLNELHQRENLDKWDLVDEEQVGKVREELIDVVLQAERNGQLQVEESQKGRKGIIFTAGNADTFERVIVTLRLLRGYGTDLPVEVFHFPGEAPTSAQEFEYHKMGAVAREVSGLLKDEQPLRTKAFHIKGAALLQSSFQEFLYLDSDSIPAKDVTPLFASPAYKEHGAMFWPDFWKDSAENAIWSILGIQCRDEWTQEAGQLLLDKSKHLDVLYLVSHMLSVSQYPFYFSLSDGDKDLFRYSFLALRKRWAVPGRHLAQASWLENDRISTNRFCGHTMLQFDANGLPQFVHANLIKRTAGTFPAGTTWGRTHQPFLPSDNITFPSNSTLSYPTSADHLANLDPSGSGIISSPSLAVRTRGLLESTLRPFFHEGHRAGFYTLCVDSDWSPLPKRIYGRRECPETEELKLTEEMGVGMRMVEWKDDEILSGFEERFYEAKGVPNGAGFRR